MRTRVSKRGQVSVPAEVREKLQIGPKTQLEWVIEGNTVRIIPLPSDPLKAFRGSGKTALEDLLNERRQERKRENA